MTFIQKYRKIKSDGVYNWQDTYETNKKVADLICKSIDLGTHTNSQIQYESIVQKVAMYVGSTVEFAEMLAVCTFEDGKFDTLEQAFEDIDKYIYKKINEYMILICGYCDERIPVKIDSAGVMRMITEPREMSSYTHKVPKDNCIEFKNREFEIKTTTDKFVILNDVRGYSDITDHFKSQSINTIGGTISAITKFANDNVISVFVGNNYMSVSKDTANENTYYLHDSGYIDDQDINNVEKLGMVCCDLWWLMGADMSQINMEKLIESGYDYVIIDVVPNSTYILEYKFDYMIDLDNNLGFKFYKKS